MNTPTPPGAPMIAALNARGLPRNPYCSRCGDTRGGPYGHETNECTWGREGVM